MDRIFCKDTKLRNQNHHSIGFVEPDVVVVSVFLFDDSIVSKSMIYIRKVHIFLEALVFYVWNPMRFFGEGPGCETKSL